MQTKYPENVPLRGKLSLLYLRTNNPDKAMEILQPVLKYHSDKPDVLNQLGGILVAQGKYNEAREVFNKLSRKLLKVSGFQILIWPSSSNILAVGRKLEKNLPENSGRKSRPDYGFCGAGQNRSSNGENEQAIKRLEALYRDNPGLTFIAKELTEIYLQNRQLNKAYDLALKITQQQKTNPLYKELLGRVYMAQGKPDQAKKILKQAVEQAQGNADMLVKISRPLLAIGAQDIARSAINTALKDQPSHFASRALLVRLELANNQLPEARKQVKVLLSQYPDSLKAYEMLGDVERASGNPEQAVSAYKKAGTSGAVLVKLVGALKRAGKANQVQGLLNEVYKYQGQWRSTPVACAGIS